MGKSTTVDIILRKPWPAVICAAHNYGPHKCSPKRDADDWLER